MGMDVYGKAPVSKTGEYFRNNVWWWRPLWDYCEMVAPELCEDVSGHTNDGDGLDAEGALELAKILGEKLKSGEVKAYEMEREAAINAIPDEPCSFCKGEGKVLVKEGWPDYVEGQDTYRDPCNSCGGSKVQRPWSSHYPFSAENVWNFVTFLSACGGFEIC